MIISEIYSRKIRSIICDHVVFAAGLGRRNSFLSVASQKIGASKSLINRTRSAGSMTSIKEVRYLEISAAWLKQPVQISEWQEEEGARFLKCMKADRRVTRLLIGESPSKKRFLADTSILETLRQVRNDTVKNMWKQTTNTAPAEDLGLDEGEQPPPKRMKHLMSSVPKVLTVHAPDVGNSGAQAMRVLAGVGADPLWIELIPANLDYLHAAATHQAATTTDDEVISAASAVPAVATNASRGVYWYAQKGAWRVEYSDPETGKTRYKFFRPEQPDNEQSKAMAAKEATEFREQHRCK